MSTKHPASFRRPAVRSSACAVLATALTLRATWAFDPSLMRESGFGPAGALEAQRVMTSDLDGDGIAEIVVSGHGCWQVLSFDPESGGYRGLAFRQRQEEDDYALYLADVTSDGHPEIVTTRGPLAEGCDPMTGALVFSGDLGEIFWGYDGVDLWADVEGDPQPEAIFLHRHNLNGALFVRRFGLFQFSWSVPKNTSSAYDVHVVAAQLDDDPAMEIVAADIVVDSDTRSVQWTLPSVAHAATTGDLDGDGRLELIVEEDLPDAVRALDVRTQSSLWEVPLSASAIAVTDADGDGRNDVVVAAGRDLVVLDSANGREKERLTLPDSLGDEIAVADVDGDCAEELVVAASSGDRWEVIGTAPLRVEWSSLPHGLDGFAVAGDMDADGREDILHGQHDPARVGRAWPAVTTPSTGLARPAAGALPDAHDVYRADACQIDGDAQLEYAYIVSGDNEAPVRARDSATHAEDWYVALPARTETSAALACGDLDGDGRDEIVHGTNLGSSTGKLRAYRPPSTTPTWTSGSLPRVTDVRVVALDADPAGEILVAKSNGVVIYDGVTMAQEFSAFATSASLATLAELDGDPAREVVAVASGPELIVWDGSTSLFEWSMALDGGEWGSLRAADLDHDGLDELVGMVRGTLDSDPLLEIRDARGRLLWQARSSLAAGRATNLIVEDLDDDGAVDIVVGDGIGLRAFEYGEPGADTLPPVFAGVAGARAVDDGCCPAVDLVWEPAADDSAADLRYEVHRSTSPGFRAGTGTLVAVAGCCGFRDARLPGDTTFEYLVQARDPGGRTDGDDVRAVVRTPGLQPSAPAGLVVEDADPCVADGVVVTFDASPGVEVTHDLLVDGWLVALDIASGFVHIPADRALHAYSVRAVRLRCGGGAASGDAFAADAEARVEPARITSVTQQDPCSADGVVVAFTHPGLARPGRHDVLVDGAVALSDVASPVVVPLAPGDHVVAIRSIDGACGAAADSQPAAAHDRIPLSQRPVIVSLEEVPCSPGLLLLHFAPAGAGADADRHELWRDGAPFVAPVGDGAAVPALDGASHSYFVRAVDSTCGFTLDSDPLSRAAAPLPCPPGDSVLLVSRSTTGGRLDWSAAERAAAYDVYVGTLAAVRSGTYDHAPASAGVTFPDAPDASRGCLAGTAARLSTRIDPLPAGDAYFIVAARSLDGTAGSHGQRSLPPLDRRDPANDPRPDTDFCP